MPRDGNFAEESQDNTGHKIGLVFPKLYHPLDEMPLGLKRLHWRRVLKKISC